MSFAAFIVKHLVRQRVRTALTALGISVGITTVVALGAIADGLKSSSSALLQAGGADFIVGQEGAADFTFSTVTEEEWAAIEQRPNVERATGALLYVARVGSNPYFFLFGTRPEQLPGFLPQPGGGTYPAPGATDEIVLGDNAASDLGVSTGETITVEDQTFKVVGVYRTGSLWQDNGGYAPLSTVQRLAGRAGVVTLVHVSLRQGVDPAAEAAAIEREHSQLAAIVNQADFGKVDQGFQMIDAANLAISLLAVGIGAIGVMNTMVMSVFERTREIGILRAVGWRGSRILRLILGESAILCLIGAVVGCGLGVLATQAVMMVGTIQGFLEPAFGMAVFIRALGVAAIVALIGAAYPAFRAVRLVPMEALRHE